jgi:hypothetical protein
LTYTEIKCINGYSNHKKGRENMSIFGNILEKLGLKKPDAKPVEQKPVPMPTITVRPGAPAAAPVKPVAKPVVPTTPPPAQKVYTDSRPLPGLKPAGAMVPPTTPMAMVDVVSKMDKMAKDSGQKLDWKVSIVDLLKLLHVDSSLAARKELAVELGCPPEKMKESKNMNIWLHKTVLQKLAENGGNIPKELLD